MSSSIVHLICLASAIFVTSCVSMLYLINCIVLAVKYVLYPALKLSYTLFTSALFLKRESLTYFAIFSLLNAEGAKEYKYPN